MHVGFCVFREFRHAKRLLEAAVGCPDQTFLQHIDTRMVDGTQPAALRRLRLAYVFRSLQLMSVIS